MLTATDAIMQDMSTSANALKVINLRLRGIKTDADDTAPSLTKMSSAFSEVAQIDMFDANGQIRKMSSLLDELYPKWDELSTNQKTYLSEQVAGKHRISQFLALMNNYGEKISATAQAYNSLDSAEKENQRYLDSAQAKINGIKSAFSELSESTINSDLLKFLLDTAKGFINIVDAVGGANVAIGLLFLTLNHFNKTPKMIMKVQTAFMSLGNAIGMTGEKGQKMWAMLGTGASMLAIIALIEAVKAIDEISVSVEEQEQKVSELSESVKGLQAEYDSLSKKKNKTSEENEELEFLKQKLEVEKQILETEKEQLYQTQFEGDVGLWDKIVAGAGKVGNAFKFMFSAGQDTEGQYDGLIAYEEQTGDLSEAIDLAVERIKTLKGENKDASDSYKELSSDVKKNKDELRENERIVEDTNAELLVRKKYLLEQKEAIEANIKANIGDREEQARLLKIINASIDSVETLTNAKGEVINSDEVQSYTSTVLADSLKSVNDEASYLADIWKEQTENGQLSLETVMGMIEKGADYINLLEVEGGIYTLNQDKLIALFETKKQTSINDLKLENQKIATQMIAIKAVLAGQNATEALNEQNASSAINAITNIVGVTKAGIQSLGEASALSSKALSKQIKATKKQYAGKSDKALRNELKALETQFNANNSAINVLTNMTFPSYVNSLDKTKDSTSKLKEATSALEKETDALKDTIDGLKEKLSGEQDELKKTEEAYKALQEAILKQIDSEIEGWEKKLDLIDEQKKEIEAMQDIAKNQIQTEIDAIQDKIDALDEEKDKEDEILKLKDAQLEAQKAQDTYDKVKGQKNMRIYSETEGWTWTADPKATQDAKDALEDANKNLDEITKEQELKKKKEELQAQIDKLKELGDAWGENMETIHDEIKDHESVIDFMTKFEKASVEERKAMLEQFTKDYENNIIKENKSTQEQIDKLKEQREQWEKSLDISTDLSKYQGSLEFLKKFENASYEERKAMLAGFTSSWQGYYKQQNAVIDDLEGNIDNLEKKLKEMQSELSRMKDSADSALGSINSLNNTNISRKVTDSKAVFTSRGLEQVTVYSDGTSTSKLLVAGTHQKDKNGNESFKAQGGMNTTYKYAKGGVDDFGETGVVPFTGKMENTKWVDGTNAKPEVILNDNQASNILYRIANESPTMVKNTESTNNVSNDIIIQNLKIEAKDNDNLQRLLLQAKQMVQVGIGLK